MRIFVGPTDHDWYTFLRDRCPGEVNFWRPSATGAFHALEPGEPFLFKAKAPHSGIIGGGFFLRYVSAPVSLAWQAFGENNGTPDVRTFFERIRKYRHDVASLVPGVGTFWSTSGWTSRRSSEMPRLTNGHVRWSAVMATTPLAESVVES